MPGPEKLHVCSFFYRDHDFPICFILGDPGADSGGEGKSKRAEKYGTKEK